METFLRLRPISIADKFLNPATKTPIFRRIPIPILAPEFTYPRSPFNTAFTTRKPYSTSSTSITRAGWLLGLGEKKKTSLPDIVKSGDPVLHEPAREVEIEEIGSERIQKIIDDMVKVMRTAPGVGLAAPQIGIPLRVSFELFFFNGSQWSVSLFTSLSILNLLFSFWVVWKREEKA